MAPIEQTNAIDYSIHPASQDNPLVARHSKSNLKTDERGYISMSKPWDGFRFKHSRLELLYTTGTGAYPPAVVKGFFKAMQKIAAASNEWDLYKAKSLKFHQLSGKRKDEFASWLTGNWRLIVTIEETETIRYLLIHNIEDYH